jgi:predicted RNase H-like HicB family nuclease
MKFTGGKMLSSYTAVVIKIKNTYAGFVKELPGAHSQGKSIEEVKENLKEAVKMVIESNYLHSIEGYKDVVLKTK